MAFNSDLAFSRLASSHRLSGSGSGSAATGLSLRNVSSYNGDPRTLSLYGLSAGTRLLSLRLFASVNDDRNNNEHDERRKKLYEMMQAMSERVKKAATVVQMEAVQAQKQLSDEEHVGFSEDELVQVTLNGAQAPVRIKIKEAALELGAEKLCYMILEAYKDAHKNTIQSMMCKMSDISADLGVQDEDFRGEIFGLGSEQPK